MCHRIKYCYYWTSVCEEYKMTSLLIENSWWVAVCHMCCLKRTDCCRRGAQTGREGGDSAHASGGPIRGRCGDKRTHDGGGKSSPTVWHSPLPALHQVFDTTDPSPSPPTIGSLLQTRYWLFTVKFSNSAVKPNMSVVPVLTQLKE